MRYAFVTAESCAGLHGSNCPSRDRTIWSAGGGRRRCRSAASSRHWSPPALDLLRVVQPSMTCAKSPRGCWRRGAAPGAAVGTGAAHRVAGGGEPGRAGKPGMRMAGVELGAGLSLSGAARARRWRGVFVTVERARGDGRARETSSISTEVADVSPRVARRYCRRRSSGDVGPSSSRRAQRSPGAAKSASRQSAARVRRRSCRSVRPSATRSRRRADSPASSIRSRPPGRPADRPPASRLRSAFREVTVSIGTGVPESDLDRALARRATEAPARGLIATAIGVLGGNVGHVGWRQPQSCWRLIVITVAAMNRDHGSHA